MDDRGSILCVEDDEHLRAAYEELFGARGYSVTAVTTGEAALVAVREHRPDVIISDVVLPGIDGLELLVQLRRELGEAAPPVIICSAFDITEKEARRRGAAAFLPKPPDPDALLFAVHLVMSGVRPSAGLGRRARRTSKQARRVAHAASSAMARQLPRDALAGHAAAGLGWLSRYLDCSAGLLFVVSRRGLQVAASHGVPTSIPRLAGGGGFAAQLLAVADARTSLIIPDLLRHHSFRGVNSNGTAMRFAVAVPVARAWEGMVVGVLALFDASPRRFSAEDLAIVEQFGRRSSLLIGHGEGAVDPRAVDDGPILERRTFERLLQLELRLAHREGSSLELTSIELADVVAAERGGRAIDGRIDQPRASVGRLAPTRLGLMVRTSPSTPRRPDLTAVVRDVPGIVSLASVEVTPGPALPPAAADLIDTAEELVAQVPEASHQPRRVVIRSDA